MHIYPIEWRWEKEDSSIQMIRTNRINIFQCGFLLIHHSSLSHICFLFLSPRWPLSPMHIDPIEWISENGDYSFQCYESFELKNLPSLISIQLDRMVFWEFHSAVFKSMNDWMNDEWDLFRLQSIILGSSAFDGDDNTIESNELIMKSMNDDNWLMRSSFSIYIQRIFQILFYRQSGFG